jgi:hypothetical protein
VGKERPEPFGAPPLVPAARLTISPEIRYHYPQRYGTISLEITRSLLYLLSSLILSILILIDVGGEQTPCLRMVIGDVGYLASSVDLIPSELDPRSA